MRKLNLKMDGGMFTETLNFNKKSESEIKFFVWILSVFKIILSDSRSFIKTLNSS